MEASLLREEDFHRRAAEVIRQRGKRAEDALRREERAGMSVEKKLRSWWKENVSINQDCTQEQLCKRLEKKTISRQTMDTARREDIETNTQQRCHVEKAFRCEKGATHQITTFCHQKAGIALCRHGEEMSGATQRIKADAYRRRETETENHDEEQVIGGQEIWQKR